MSAPAFLELANRLAASGALTGITETSDGRPLVVVTLRAGQAVELELPAGTVRVEAGEALLPTALEEFTAGESKGGAR